MGTKKGQRRKTARRAYKKRRISVRKMSTLPGGWKKGDPYQTVIPGKGIYQHSTKAAALRQAKAASRVKASRRQRGIRKDRKRRLKMKGGVR